MRLPEIELNSIWIRFVVILIVISVESDVEAKRRAYTKQGNFKSFLHRHYDDEITKLSKLDTVEYIEYFGYNCETHKVTTQDKYILTMHHISARNENVSKNSSKPVVFLQHGVFSWSGDWFLSGPNKSLGFALVDAGFDVWAGNARGNRHSRHHEIYDPDVDAKFWDFSFHEIGAYDVPAMIDHILNATGNEQLFYIGHSQGTTVYYVLMSEYPEYNEKIIAQYSLSPIAYLSNATGAVLKLLKFMERFIEFGIDLLHIHELKHDNIIFKYMFHKFCSTHFVLDLCLNELFSFVGYNPKQFNTTLLPIILANFPAGASTKQLTHYGQELRSGHFEQYDYGHTKNLQHYHDYYPPSYDLSQIKAPIYLFCSGNDHFSSLTDVKKLYWALPEGNKHFWMVEDKMWNHIDYIWGIQAKELVYDKIIINMLSYSPLK